MTKTIKCHKCEHTADYTRELNTRGIGVIVYTVDCVKCGIRNQFHMQAADGHDRFIKNIFGRRRNLADG